MHGEARSTIAIWLVAGGLAVFAAFRLLGGGAPAAAPVRIDERASAAGRADAPAGARRRGPDVYVHVVGAVRRPGVFRVPPGSRVAAALDRAGGPLARADLTLVNLAAKVQDGQQIVVPVAGQAAGAAAPAAGGSATPLGAKIHLSTATVEELEQIDGIGPALAGRIVAYRTEHAFRSLDELGEVEGIGEKRLATLRDALQP